MVLLKKFLAFLLIVSLPWGIFLIAYLLVFLGVAQSSWLWRVSGACIVLSLIWAGLVAYSVYKRR